jgi:prolyl-tRNA editing enzyme YbaK/EbsC (Cys-tRNA(Pro) deacylase)
VVKALVMEDAERNPLLVLMHGDMKVSTKGLARAIGVKFIQPCSPETANRHTGYLVGLAPDEVVRARKPTLVQVGMEES